MDYFTKSQTFSTPWSLTYINPNLTTIQVTVLRRGQLSPNVTFNSDRIKCYNISKLFKKFQMYKNQNIEGNKIKSFSKRMKMNTKIQLTFQSISIKLSRLLNIRSSVPNYETLSKGKTWGANYKIGETC